MEEREIQNRVAIPLRDKDGPQRYDVMTLLQTLGRVRHKISTLIKLWRKIGTLSTLQWLLFRLGRHLRVRWPATLRLCPRQAQHALTVRLRGSSDLDVFSQIFIEKEYAPLRSLENVSLVLDLGANVGYSSAYFLSCFPNSRVVAVEPDERNVAACRANLKPYASRAHILHGAVWATPTALCLSKGTFRDGREWATQVFQPLDCCAGDVQAWDVSSLIDMIGAEKVDLLKVDIERAELAVFDESAKKWLPSVRNICIELHGPDCEETFFNALASFDYELEFSGELTICRNVGPSRGGIGKKVSGGGNSGDIG
jgi:FkbM family methyltransferase